MLSQETCAVPDWHKLIWDSLKAPARNLLATPAVLLPAAVYGTFQTTGLRNLQASVGLLHMPVRSFP